MNTIIPIDILVEIASNVSTGHDVLNLSLASKRIHDHIYPILFRDIELRDNHARQIVQYLLLRPKVARTVQSLVLRPSFLQMCSKKLLARERDLAHDVGLLAPNLYNLRKFVWDGIEIPASSMWASLKLGCPHLSEIGTNLGGEPVDPESELFGFSDLTGFSLTSELHYDTLPNFDPIVFCHGEELPPALWTMLIERSPRLQTLVLGDNGAIMHNQRRISVRPFLHARWPYLHSLSITRACIDDLRDELVDFDSTNKRKFAAFIEAHHNSLRHLSYYAFGGEIHVDHRDPPLLEHQGRDYLPRMRDVRLPLQEISLTGIKFCGELLLELKQQLSGQRELRKLEIWMDFSEHVQQLDPQEQDCMKPMAYDQTTELRELFESCPRGLESLKLILSTNEKETIYWRDIPQILPRNTQKQDRKYQLKHLEVWKAPKSKEYGLKDAAIRIALAETYSTPDSDPSSSPVIPSSIEFAAPGLETIVLVGCLCAAKARLRYERMHVLFHGKYRVHRQTVSDEEDSDWPFVDNTRGILPSLAAFTGKTHAPTQVKTVPQAFVTLTANERGAEWKPTWVIPRYYIQLGASMGANKLMMKGKKIGKKILATNSPSQREWYMLKSSDEPNVIRRTWRSIRERNALVWEPDDGLEVNLWRAWNFIILVLMTTGLILQLFCDFKVLGKNLANIGSMGAGVHQGWQLWRIYQRSR